MRIIIKITRLLFACVFIFSGLAKIIDPTGTSLIVEEYLRVMHLKFLSFGSLYFGIVLSITELLIGVAILWRLRYKLFVCLGAAMTVFFTILTFFLAIFNPISDCGCFGTLVHLTNWETFFKNIVLLFLIGILFTTKDKVKLLESVRREFVVLGIVALLNLLVVIRALINGPITEFTDYAVGSDIAEKVQVEELDNGYETIFIYEKDGKQKEFSLEALPDSTWVYVDSKTKTLADVEEVLDFAVFDSRSRDITSDVLDSSKPIIVTSIYKESYLDKEKHWAVIEALSESLMVADADYYIFSNLNPQVLENELVNRQILNVKTGYLDYKTIISFNRLNGGLTNLRNGVVLGKWRGNMGAIKSVLKYVGDNYEMAVIDKNVKRRVLWQILIVLLVIGICVVRKRYIKKTKI